MHVWNVLHAAHWKYRTQKLCKKLPSAAQILRTIEQLRWAISLQLRHVSTIAKKLVKQQYLMHMSPQYGELQPTNGWDLLASLEHPSKFQRVSHLGFTTALASLHGGQSNFVWMSRGPVHYIYIFRSSCLPADYSARCKIYFASKSCILLYWQHYCVALKQWA